MAAPERFRVHTFVIVGLVAASLTCGGSAAMAEEIVGGEPQLEAVDSTADGGGEAVLQPGQYYDQASVDQELAELGFTTLDGEPESTDLNPEISQKGSGSCVGCYTSSYQSKKNGTQQTKGMLFVRHLTSAWAKATSYTWSQDTSVSATLSASIGPSAGAVAGSIGVSASKTASWGVAVNIPVDKKKYSKLSLRSDFYQTPVKARLVQKAALKPTIYGPWKTATHMAPTNNQYLTVTYK